MLKAVMRSAMRVQHIEPLIGLGGFFRRAAHLLPGRIPGLIPSRRSILIPGLVPGLALALSAALPLAGQQSAGQQRIERPALNITGYVIDAEIDTATHHLAAKSAGHLYRAGKRWTLVSFGFHPALKVTKITDLTGKLLTGERSADGTIRVTPGCAVCEGPGASLDL
jgi:hypothetical protein